MPISARVAHAISGTAKPRSPKCAGGADVEVAVDVEVVGLVETVAPLDVVKLQLGLAEALEAVRGDIRGESAGQQSPAPLAWCRRTEAESRAQTPSA